MVLDGYTVGRLTTPSGLIDDTIVINYGNDNVSATARIHAEPGETVTIYHDNGKWETVLPTSVVARHVLQNLQIEIINAEFAGNQVRLKHLVELQTEWSWIRRDLLRSEVEQKLGVRTLSKTYVPRGTHKKAIDENALSDSIVRPAAEALELYANMSREAHIRSSREEESVQAVQRFVALTSADSSRDLMPVKEEKNKPKVKNHEAKIITQPMRKSYDQVIEILMFLDLILLCILCTLLYLEPTILVGCFNCMKKSGPYQRL